MPDLDFVTDADPVISVRVANQQHLPVVAIGVATVFVEALRVTLSGGVRRSTKVRVPMRLSNVYVVPGIACASSRVAGASTVTTSARA